MFGFLARRAGLSGRRWRDAMPALERLVRARGEKAAWDEIERIERAAKLALNPGGYAFACLFPNGLDKPAHPLAALPRAGDPGPLFATLAQEEREGSPQS